MALARAFQEAVYVVGAVRTPFGSYGGRLAALSNLELMEKAARAALTASGLPPSAVSTVIVGNVYQSTPDGPGISRYTSIRLGVPLEAPAYNVNRLCGSGFQAVVSGAQEICMGGVDVALTGGVESMSQCPHTTRQVRFGVRLGVDIKLTDSLWEGLIDQQNFTPMGVTAENLAEKYNITREQCDEFALDNQARWKKAQDGGQFDDEMAPVTIKTKKGEEVMSVDEHPKPSTTAEQLARLPAVFKKGGTVTAATASGICDGAGSIVLATEAACRQHNLTPLARVVGYGVAGCDPLIMGIGPVPAIRALMNAVNMNLADINLIEVNEAFVAQFLAVQKELDLDPAKTNIHGGATSLGHPVGASGSRIIAHLTHQLRRRGEKYAIGSACIGGGQGIAVLLENVA